MYADNFNGKAGKVINARTAKHGEYLAFVPNSLPIPLDTNKMSILLERAAKELGNLNGLITLLPNPYLLTKPYTQKEAVMSSRIEGTQTSFEEILIAEAGGKPAEENYAGLLPKQFDIIEVRNLITAMEEGVESIKTTDIDLSLILRLHRILMAGVRGEDKHPGELRKVQNWIGAPGTKIQDARYVPPPPEYVEGKLTNMLEYAQSKENVPILLKIAMIHYQFEAVHPFEDGNGRIGRLLVILYLIKNNLLKMPMLYLSGYFARKRTLYYDLLFKTSQKGAYDEWISFFLNGIIEQSIEVAERAETLLKYSNEMKTQMANERSTHVISAFESLLSNPFITIPRIAKTEGVSYPSAKHIVEKLVGYNILSLFPSGGKSKLYAAHNILGILNGENRTPHSTSA